MVRTPEGIVCSAGESLIERRRGRDDGRRGLVLRARVARGTVVMVMAAGLVVCAMRRAVILFDAMFYALPVLKCVQGRIRRYADRSYDGRRVRTWESRNLPRQ
jgi:hypothetical protein